MNVVEILEGRYLPLLNQAAVRLAANGARRRTGVELCISQEGRTPALRIG